MSRLATMFVAVGTLAFGSCAIAQSGAELVKSKGCVNCHAPDTRKIGPSFKELAAKYRGDPAAIDRLAAALKAGRAHPKFAGSDAELQALVSYMVLGK